MKYMNVPELRFEYVCVGTAEIVRLIETYFEEAIRRKCSISQ